GSGVIRGIPAQILITFALPSIERSAARSAMNSRYRSAAGIIARSTAVATKRHGGKRLALIRSPPPARSGCRPIRFRQAPRRQSCETHAPERLLVSPTRGRPPRAARITKRSQFRLFPDDLFQTDRRQPPQRCPEHRADYGGRQATLPLQ